jgi:hypothetical protein
MNEQELELDVYCIKERTKGWNFVNERIITIDIKE